MSAAGERDGAAVTPLRAGRRISLLDCVGIGINGIIGSGIFLLPGLMAQEAGAASVLAFIVCGVLLALIGLCFAEAAGRFERSGGSYLYAREAFGETAGFAVGWMSLVTGVLGMAAVARGFAGSLVEFVPALRGAAGEGAVGAALLIVLGALNARGIKVGARASDVFSVAKLLPLLFFVVVGAAHIDRDAFARLGVGAAALDLSGFAGAVFLAAFALSGFEVVPVPAGETERSRRAVPIAIVGALLGVAALYAVIQIVAIGTHPSIAGSERPLAEAAGAMLGPAGATLIGVGAVISMAGFCAGSAITIPRYVTTLAEDEILPARFAARDARTNSPVLAILVTSLAGALGAAFLDFGKLVDISVTVVFIQYVGTCLAVLTLRRTRPDLPYTWRLPGGPTIPALAIVVSIALLFAAKPGRREMMMTAIILGIGMAAYGLRRRFRSQ
jgi:basic amino acid/polyamine antiporter, APA family